MARGKTSTDASELEKLEWPYDWPPPWRSQRLLGHETAEKTMLAAHQSGRLHHAWLLAGPRGIGKATLAWRFARFLLSGQAGASLFGGEPDSLDVPADAPGRSLVDARSHPDLFHLRRTLNPDTGRMRAEIAVDDVRELGAFMHMTPAMGKWRVAIVDAADEMNRNSANAVLKILEEPPPNAVLLMVAHAPGRLLPTIRSRCRRLALQPLAEDIVVRLLGDYAPDAEGRGEGGPGAAQRGQHRSRARTRRRRQPGTLPRDGRRAGDPARTRHGATARLCRTLRAARRGGQCGLAFAQLPVRWLAERPGAALRRWAGKLQPSCRRKAACMRDLLAAASLDRWMEAWEKAAHLLSGADRVNLDRKQTVLGSFLALQSAMR